MKNYTRNVRLNWYILTFGMVIAVVMFIPMNTIIKKLRQDEQKKVELWAAAVNNKAELIKRTQDFYQKASQSEQTRLQQFIDAYKIIMSQSEDADLSSPKLRFYTKIIMDNKTIPVIITDEFNNITLSQNVDIPQEQTVLTGDLLRKFSRNKPFEYEVYGMKFKLYYTSSLVYSDLKDMLDDLTNSLLNEVAENYVFVPVIVTDSAKEYIYISGNIPADRFSKENLKNTIDYMTKDNTPIKISMYDNKTGYIYYKRSPELTVLKYYPFLYAFILILMALLLFQIFRTMKISEQNSVWIGMSKETAHQLGTPISSLMGWTELLRMNPENEQACKEIDKDIARLNLITQRFSQIGSAVDLKQQDITLIIYNAVSYLQLRIPKKVNFVINVPLNHPLMLPLNKPLFEWTVENLIKNAVDAMEGSGTITIDLEEKSSHVHLDITDTGKGMERNQFKQIFRPGYTTKKRGWGLGRSLVKRIIEEYHKGKIYVKNSAPNEGTTFRIELYKSGK